MRGEKMQVMSGMCGEVQSLSMQALDRLFLRKAHREFLADAGVDFCGMCVGW